MQEDRGCGRICGSTSRCWRRPWCCLRLPGARKLNPRTRRRAAMRSSPSHLRTSSCPTATDVPANSRAGRPCRPTTTRGGTSASRSITRSRTRSIVRRRSAPRTGRGSAKTRRRVQGTARLPAVAPSFTGRAWPGERSRPIAARPARSPRSTAPRAAPPVRVRVRSSERLRCAPPGHRLVRARARVS